jgi:hypothetical protein
MTEGATGPQRVPTVYLHIGAFKTGTTYLQQVLRFSHEALADQGMLFPGDKRWRNQVAGARDLLGMSTRGGDDVDVRGGWNALVRQIKAWDGPSALVSMEFLSMAGPRQVRRAVRALEPAEVHVVVTARDLARVVPAMWQETLKAGNTWTWADYIAALRDPDRAAIPPALGFWICQDLPAILNVWEAAVPRERIHVVTVPPPGAPPRLLMERFCEVVGLDVERLSLDAPWSNESLGAAECEALRRLNASLGEKTRRRQYQRVTKQVIARRLSGTTPSSERMSLPSEHQIWASKRAREMADALVERGYHVVGDLEDIVPDPGRPTSGRSPDDVNDTEVLDASTRAATALVDRLAQGRSLKEPEALESEIGLRQTLASEARGVAYRFKRKVATASRHNRATARAVTTYRRAVLKRRGSRR